MKYTIKEVSLDSEFKDWLARLQNWVDKKEEGERKDRLML